MLTLTTCKDMLQLLEENAAERTIGRFLFDGEEGLALSETSIDGEGFPRVKVLARVLEGSSADQALYVSQHGDGHAGIVFNPARHEWGLAVG
jgi:hypothetical protein